MEDASIFIDELLLCSLRFLSFIIRSPSQDSIANAGGALVVASLQLATGIRPVGRKAHNASPA
jgi:hypothetical protein